jgi:hypothetical protein
MVVARQQSANYNSRMMFPARSAKQQLTAKEEWHFLGDMCQGSVLSRRCNHESLEIVQWRRVGGWCEKAVNLGVWAVGMWS